MTVPPPLHIKHLQLRRNPNPVLHTLLLPLPILRSYHHLISRNFALCGTARFLQPRKRPISAPNTHFITGRGILFTVVEGAGAEAFGEEGGEEGSQCGEADAGDADTALSGGPDEGVGDVP